MPAVSTSTSERRFCFAAEGPLPSPAEEGRFRGRGRRRRQRRALASLLSLLLLSLFSLLSLLPAPSSAQYLSSLPYGVPRDDITVRLSLLGGGLGPVGRGELGVTVKAFQDTLNWLGDSIAVRGARLERRPVDGPGTATVDVTISADARRLDLILGLVRETVEDQEVGLRVFSFFSLSESRERTASAWGRRRRLKKKEFQCSRKEKKMKMNFRNE